MVKVKKVYVPAGVERPIVPGKKLSDDEFAAYVDFIADLTGKHVKVTKEQAGDETLATIETTEK